MMKLLVFALVGVLGAVSADNKFDGLVDELIWEMEQDMINKSATVVSLPDVSKEFHKKVLFFNVDGSFSLKGGKVQNLSTIYRVGDVTPTQNDTTGSLTLTGTFALKDLTLKADNIDIKVSIIHISDPLTVKIGKNAATFQVSLIFDEDMNCKSVLNQALISQFGDFSISLGSGTVSSLEGEIAQYVLNKLAPTIQSAINGHIFPIVDNAIQKLDLCNKFML